MIQQSTVNRHRKSGRKRRGFSQFKKTEVTRERWHSERAVTVHTHFARESWIPRLFPPRSLSAHQRICISYCKSLAATDSLLNLLVKHLWIKCALFSRRRALARRAASGRLTLISPNNTSIDSSAGTIDRAQAFLRLKWQDNMVLWKASGVRVVGRWACPH